ncbi:MAG: Oxidoreductase, FAD-binding [Ktedonobacterales bacterium]|jgi:FAD-linked oxidoreductase|nr:MAG: Oxidoreductase, FAD-binding [Ktedonobacterales bacterium]
MCAKPSRRFARNWQNWSGSVQSTPREIVTPRSLDELAQRIGAYGRDSRRVRVVGGGHSFTPLVQTNDVLLSLDGLQGIQEVNGQRGTVKVWGGTRLKRLGNDLLALGRAQENLGDIDVQSIAGAISTGTHGTGVRFGNIATQVVGLTLVTATGDIAECSSDQHPDLFKAAQVSLGALGVIASVTLRTVPAKRLRFQVRRERVDSCLANLERYKQENDHFEFFWLPYTPWAQAKFLNETDAPAKDGNLWGTFNKIVLENGVYWVLSEACRLAPPLTQTVSKISAQAISSSTETDYSHRLYATPRMVRFREMEYNIPAEHFTTVLAEIRECIQQRQFKVHFPIECRFAHADDIWLSPAYQRPSSYIAVHMYRGMAYEDYFAAIEAIFRRYQGRPHWGKMHTRTADELAALYPRWDDFCQVRATLDPQGIFLNDYLRHLFAVDAPHAQHSAAFPSPHNAS